MRRAAVLVLLLVAGGAGAHSPSPGSVIALAAGDAVAGVTRAERDPTNPRVLVVRVGPSWFVLDAGERLARARRWRDDWRHAVPQGVVAILDAASQAPVVGFGARGTVHLAPAAPSVDEPRR